MRRRLPFDVSRCAGRFGLGPDDPLCPRRGECLRYLALLDHPKESAAMSDVSTGLCRDGGDYLIPVEGAAA